MDVGMMMVFASYGWENCSDARVWDEEIRLARTRRRSGLRLPVVGRTPLQRLLVRAGQHPADDLSDGALPEYRCRHGRRDPALARSAAGRRTGRGAGQSVQGPVPVRHGPRPRAPRIRRLPSQHGRIARTLRRGRADDRQRAEDRLHRRRRAVLQAAAHRDPAAAAALLRRPHLRRGVQRGLRSVRRQTRRPYGDVRRPAVGDAAAGDRARAEAAPPVPRHRSSRTSC